MVPYCLSLFHSLNSLIAPPKILKDSCLSKLSALTTSVTVNKSKIHRMTVTNIFQNNVMFMNNPEQRRRQKSSNKLFISNYSPTSCLTSDTGLFSKLITAVFKNYNKWWQQNNLRTNYTTLNPTWLNMMTWIYPLSFPFVAEILTSED